MNDMAVRNDYGTLSDPTTLMIRRVLPGPIERIWSYLTDSELRAKWLASGDMPLAAGEGFELTWRNDRLADGPATPRPEGFGEEHSMKSRIVEVEPPRRLVFTWGEKAEVSFTLIEKGSEVVLTVTHRRVSDRAMLLMVSAGWHAHLDVLAAVVAGTPRPDFWARWAHLKTEYETLLPA